MALDNANFIAELSITDPPGTDPLSQGDDHIRTCKRATQQSFPNIDKAVTITADQMNLMAIKNEANVFTDLQTLQDANLALDSVTDRAASINYRTSGNNRWLLTMQDLADTNNFRLSRHDATGLFLDAPWTVDSATGIVDFAHVPTVQGDPIWIPGEVKLIVQGASLPSNNWFVCTGTNGTVDLRDRILGAQGVFFGNQTPFLDAQLDPGQSVGSTALTEAQLAAHNHRVLGDSDGTSTEVVGMNTGLARSVGGRTSGAARSFFDSPGGDANTITENTGSGSGHTHTIPEVEVNTAGLDAFQVMPYTYFFQPIQYVP